MICPKCGGNNLDGSTYCVKCGVSLKEATPIIENNNEIATNVNPVVENNVNVNNSTVMEPNTKKSGSSSNINYKDTAMGFFTYGINIFLKPFESFKKEESKLNDSKNSFMFAGFIAICMMLVTLITRMISSIFYKNYFSGKLVFEISNLKNLNYVNLILKNLLIYACALLFVAGVYYVVSLILKKNVSFTKLLNVTSTSVIPFIALSMFAPTIISYIWNPLAIISFAAGIIYFITIFANLIDEIITFENKDMKIYFHAISWAVIVLLGGYILYKSLLGSLTGSLYSFF